MRQFDSLLDNVTVYRALLRKQWIDEDTGRVKADAYFLRVNERGLSVFFSVGMGWYFDFEH